MEPVFVVRGPDGHEYRIYTDGQTDGFPPDSTVANRIPLYVERKTKARGGYGRYPGFVGLDPERAA